MRTDSRRSLPRRTRWALDSAGPAAVTVRTPFLRMGSWSRPSPGGAHARPVRPPEAPRSEARPPPPRRGPRRRRLSGRVRPGCLERRVARVDRGAEPDRHREVRGGDCAGDRHGEGHLGLAQDLLRGPERSGRPGPGEGGRQRLREAAEPRAGKDVHHPGRLHRGAAHAARREVVRAGRPLGQLRHRRRPHPVEGTGRGGGGTGQRQRRPGAVAAVGGSLPRPGERLGALQGPRAGRIGRVGWCRRPGPDGPGVRWRPVVRRGERVRDVGRRVPGQPPGLLEGAHHHPPVPEQARPPDGPRLRRRLGRRHGRPRQPLRGQGRRCAWHRAHQRALRRQVRDRPGPDRGRSVHPGVGRAGAVRQHLRPRPHGPRDHPRGQRPDHAGPRVPAADRRPDRRRAGRRVRGAGLGRVRRGGGARDGRPGPASPRRPRLPEPRPRLPRRSRRCPLLPRARTARRALPAATTPGRSASP